MPIPLMSRIIRQVSWVRHIKGGLRGMIYLAPMASIGDDIVISNAGSKFHCDFGSYIEWRIYHCKGYEGSEIALFTALFDSDSCLLDIGANIGNHTLSFSRRVRSVHAFEPNPEIFQRLQGNISLNGTTNVFANGFALGRQNGLLAFYAPTAKEGPQGTNMGMGTFVCEEAPHPHKIINLQVVIGDQYIDAQEVPRIDGMKVDVQGFELDVLTGLSRTLERDQPIVWMECSTATLKAISQMPQGLRQIIPYAYKLQCFRTNYIGGLIHQTQLVELGDSMDPPFTGNFVIVPHSRLQRRVAIESTGRRNRADA
jgi:FkbM family methyltransferase